MNRMKRWAALLLCLLVFTDCMPVEAVQQTCVQSVTPEETEEITTPEEVVTPEEIATPGEMQDPVEAVGDEVGVWYDVNIKDPITVMVPGDTYTLEVETDAPRDELVYESTNPAAATISDKGVVTAINGGTEGSVWVGITVRWENPDQEGDTCSDTCYIRIQNQISISRSNYTIYTGQKTVYQLSAATNPAGTITWSSSDPTVAAVDASGKLTAIKEGRTTITATANGVTADCEVTVKKPNLSLKSRATIYVKNPTALGAKAYPSAKISFKSSNKKIATVNSKGIVTGKRTGTVKITAKVHGITKTCRVTVKKPSISIYNAEYNLFCGSSTQLNASATPGDAAITWKSSNPKVAKVDKNGNVTGVKAGTAVITASIPGAKTTCQVKVYKDPYKLNFTKRTIMKGQSVTLLVQKLASDAFPSFEEQNYSGSISMSTNDGHCMVTGVEKGTAVIRVSFQIYKDGSFVQWSRNCTIKIQNEGISSQQFSLAKGGKKKLKVLNAPNQESIQTIAWKSSAAKVAAVDAVTGEVTAKKSGSAVITATITYLDGTTKAYKANMKVSDPKFASTGVAVAIYGAKQISLKGTNAYSEVSWKSKKKSVVSVSESGLLLPRKRGKAVITATVDGRTISCNVYVSDPALTSSYSALAPGSRSTIELSGLTSKSKVAYSSSNIGVATVSKSGVITAVSGGRSEITITADGRKFSYLVEVASQAALNACAEGKSIMDRSSYSQAYRMTEGYYDCSSLVFRAYGRNSGLLGGSYSWAPTAAGMAQHMASTGKVISWGPVNVEDLRPGDLIFYGQQNNGRYLGIYHVSMYYGNGSRLEVGMYGYYPRGNIVMVARPVP